MKLCTFGKIVTGALFGAACVQAHATACLVIGEASAKVHSSEGERSPVFMAQNCESLRLVSGKAQASWVGRDGKPHMVAITDRGPDQVPPAGSEERSVKVVWSELSNTREIQRPGYMRALSDLRAPKVYLPESGLTLLPKADVDAELSVTLVRDEKAGDAARFIVSAGQPVKLPREWVKPGEVYIVKLRRGDTVEQWRWRILKEDDARQIDDRLKEIQEVVTDDQQRRMMEAMLFEQMKLPTNMTLTLHEGRLPPQ